MFTMNNGVTGLELQRSPKIYYNLIVKNTKQYWKTESLASLIKPFIKKNNEVRSLGQNAVTKFNGFFEFLVKNTGIKNKSPNLGNGKTQVPIEKPEKHTCKGSSIWCVYINWIYWT